MTTATSGAATAAIEGFRLSPQQRRLWQLARDSRAFKVQALVTFEGPPERVTAEAVRAALAALVARTEILRTTYRRSPGVRFPLQVVAAELPPQWQGAEEGADVEALFAKALGRPFDLERGPLVHAVWIPSSPGRAELILGLPSIAADAQALDQLIVRLGREINRPESAEEPVQYVQVSEWANELLQSDESRAGREHFRARDLAPLFSLSLPLESRAAGGFAPERIAVGIDRQVASSVAALAEAWGTDERAVLLAAWTALVARMSGMAEVGVGVRLDGRTHPDLADALGAFARTVPQLARADDARTLAELAKEIGAAVAESADWQDCFSTDEDDRYGTGFPASFSYRTPADPDDEGPVRLVVARRVANVERSKLALEAERGPRGLALTLAYDTRAFSADAAAVQSERFAAFLAALVAAPESPIGDPDLLTGRERQRLAAFNATEAPYPSSATVGDLFLAQAEAAPANVALRAAAPAAVEVSYADLAARAEKMALALAERGAGPGGVVAILSERSVDMVVAILGVLRAGAAYLPLDSAYPRERIAFMLEDSGAELVLAQESLLPLLDPERAVSPRTIALGAVPENGAACVSLAAAGPDDLAYVLYTSGSTGKPKGVMVPHRGVVNYLHWAIGAYEAGAGAAPLHSPIGFDLTVTSLLAPLCSGGTVELLADERGVEALAETLRAGAGYSLVKLTPAHLALLGPIAAQGEAAAWARTLIVGGEALAGETLAPWTKRAGQVRIVNEYGPTETVVGCSAYIAPASAVVPGPVPIGRPIANARIHLLDGRGRPVPEGVPGEIYIGGAGLARGYHGRPDLSAERFVPDPFGEPGSRLYKSGDLARLMPSGDLEFLGRNDHQVKVRGVRLELGEIEATLAGAPGVREAAVLAREDKPGERRLVAYYTTDRDPAPNVDELRRHLAASLPEAMVPALFLRLPELPLTANGKLDRAALPAPGNARPDLEHEYVAPRNETEAALVEIWSEVLGLERIGVEDSFFALGGDSIRSVRVIALAREKGIELTVEELFRHPTVAALAEHASSAAAGTGEAGAAAPGAPAAGEEQELAALLAELEGLSDEEVAARLRAEETSKS